ncbi:MAG: sigma-54-dependent Fis family transcriptional regulator [Chlorobiaceae bacterium]|nr:sigma-54-dependent Fis family transcriptional regulator [Chlorobiaceae bacterium]NTW73906.1 sigma-54-dependent Fis family transcriptional regulator [Chlorobiaceae bacterium]
MKSPETSRFIILKPEETHAGQDKNASSKLVLIADDDSSSRKLLGHFISKMGYNTQFAEDGEICIELINKSPVDILLLDINMPKKDGFDVMSYLAERNIRIPVIMVTASNEIPLAVRCIKMGAYEYLTKPLDIERLRIVFRNAIKETVLQNEVQQLKKELRTKEVFRHIIGKSGAIKRAMEQAMQVMETDLNVLLLGESGTGKELFAQAIHQGSRRKTGPFVSINCAAISSELADSLLFGHKKGAFTGANSDHVGFFEQADGGTIFLDEIGDMTSEIQAKVLRVLQERQIRRVGEKSERSVDFRVISATNQNFARAIDNNTFREDLYYRLEEFPIGIPPLRERKEDITILASYFLDQFCSANNLGAMQISENTLSNLGDYHWPGNVRELKNAVQRAAVTSRGQVIEKLVSSLQTSRQASVPQEPSKPVDQGAPDVQEEPVARPDSTFTMDELEKAAVQKAFSNAHGNASKAAESLGISRATFYRKLKRYGISE